VIVGLNFVIKITVIVGSNITRPIFTIVDCRQISYVPLIISVVKTAFGELKLNPTITTYSLSYNRRERIIVTKKSADFTDFWTLIRYVQLRYRKFDNKLNLAKLVNQNQIAK